MKIILQIVVVGALLFACFNAGKASFTNYRFEDSVHEGLLFNPRATEPQIVEMVMKSAQEFDVPITQSGIAVKNVGPDVHVDMTYTMPVVLIPGLYTMNWTFKPSASTRFLAGVSR